MFRFALPLILSGILQQSFNSVDVAVVGRFSGSHALAAVGSNGPVIGLLLNMFIGLSVGVNVVIANHIGQDNKSAVRRTVQAATVLALICSALMVVVSQAVARPILEALSTPPEVLDQAVEYLRIFSLGIPFIIIYNFSSAVLRSVGDTRRPFYALVIAGIINVLLNLLFVIQFQMGVAGVAWATSIANVVGAGIVTVLLIREKSDIHLDLKDLSPNWQQMGKICRIGLPAGIQSTVFSISNIFILGAINSFGAFASAGSAAALNYELYCYNVINAFGQTAVAFVSQNYGAGQLKRCRRTLKISILYSIVSCAACNLIITWKSGLFLSIFSTEPTTLSFASVRISTCLLFQWIASYYEMTGSAMRGMGHSMTPALITIFGTCVVRLLWVAYFPYQGNFALLLLVYPVSWLLTDIIMAAAYIYFRNKEKSNLYHEKVF